MDQLPLKIRTAIGVCRFTVEVARTPQEQELGLSFRQALHPEMGMIFPQPRPRVISLWMKDVLIPLDIIFIRPDATITRVAANRTPLSLDPVSSGEQVDAVLEIAGGRASELGIAAGDQVDWAGTRSVSG